ncbi:hypothetical protein ABB37_06995 [Leptomonas pyrrhocoris]|uniref:Uncharacterized protein n=1 Tax=Leptomonas pyrrhocoris TaxID=157538 RepID=A0A0M9FWP9_LEPPY|nr:hypothetical protein ABB37_06995 [Leptomonas pyrrhocoris]KPA77640.1 hypothetical protein ABB37_06995 [Leptomonas pyrrhocoris]|eukprot:XP_015656079.1 hypothetical protein ABB37_06995 [Leptomonas pyrrhocoris]
MERKQRKEEIGNAEGKEKEQKRVRRMIVLPLSHTHTHTNLQYPSNSSPPEQVKRQLFSTTRYIFFPFVLFAVTHTF